jgi:hypothetical protein
MAQTALRLSSASWQALVCSFSRQAQCTRRPTLPSRGHAPASRVMPLMSNVRRHMKLPFAFGFSVPAAVAFIAALLSSQSSKVPLLVGAALLLVAASLASGGFEIGRQMQPVSSAPIVSRWRVAVVATMGFTASVISLPVGLLVVARLSGPGAWQPIAVGVWFLAVGMVCGYLYGPAFRRLASRFPAVREGESAA